MVLKDVAKNWLPPAILTGSQRLREELRFQLTAEKAVLAKNRALKGIGLGRKVFLLATGPSLKKEKLAQLKGQDVVSVSNFFLHPLAKKLAPKLHFFASVHPPLDWGNIAAWFAKADKALPAETAMVTTFTNKPLVEQYGLFQRRKVYYLYVSAFPSPRGVDLERPVLGPQTIPLLALPVLIYMGYKEIGLLGCDHTVLRDLGGRIRHFFKPKADIRKGASDAAAWADVITSHKESLNVFDQYDFYRRMGGPAIINYSQDSWLDLFPFKRLGKR